ncbi:hypothetical protein [Maribellus sediminis]|uniref:hypothetical protein n=1 Tax=Maribellus sediminis TaxID=2696285 RepID=UPI0014311C86|nr:hypothetical protein [Maribellus sediminis]
MRLLLILLTGLILLFGGKPAKNTGVYLEKGSQLIAYQITGEKGKVSFTHLDAGSYRISLLFPQQEGKYMDSKPKHRTMSKASYNAKKKTYYYQGNEGFFAIKFDGMSKIKSENFKAVFKEEKDENDTYKIIVQFGAHGNNASIDIAVEALTASQYKKTTDKASDISTLSIPNIR